MSTKMTIHLMGGRPVGYHVDVHLWYDDGLNQIVRLSSGKRWHVDVHLRYDDGLNQIVRLSSGKRWQTAVTRAQLALVRPTGQLAEAGHKEQKRTAKKPVAG